MKQPVTNTVNFGINNSKTESKADKHSQNNASKVARGTTLKKLEMQLARV